MRILVFCGIRVIVMLIMLSGLPAIAQDQHLIVYFPFGASELDADERKHVLYFLTDTLDHDRIQSIEIRGYCDYIDNSSFNDSLSLARANHVAGLLKNNGIPSQKISSVTGFGERKASEQKSSEAERQLQRRVEVDFICTCHGAAETTEAEKEEEKKQEITGDEVRVIQGDTVQDRKGVRYKGRYLVGDDFELNTFDIGDSIVLLRLHFQPGKHKLLRESVPTLYRLTDQMKANPNMHIIIVGHICCSPTSAPDGLDNDTGKYELSRNRAKEIYAYLVSQGIEEERLAYAWMGPKDKLYPEERDAREMQGNRRVEIVVTAK